jgi:Domain of unknown function (DUF4288)
MEAGSNKTWFGAKTVYRHPALEREPGASCYEERVVLICASDEDEALELAEAEAAQYADGADTRFLGYTNVFRIDDAIGPGAEVFSIMRTMTMSEDEFVTRFYDDGTFHTR